jgi:hypothetical protein
MSERYNGQLMAVDSAMFSIQNTADQMRMEIESLHIFADKMNVPRWHPTNGYTLQIGQRLEMLFDAPIHWDGVHRK